MDAGNVNDNDDDCDIDHDDNDYVGGDDESIIVMFRIQWRI